MLHAPRPTSCRQILALALALSAMCRASALELAQDYANLRERGYFVRVSIGQCDEERPVARVVCDGPFALHDRQGKILFSGPANMPLRLTSHDTAPGASVYYFILDTFRHAERAKAEAYAAKARGVLKRPVSVRPDPRHDWAPPPTGDLRPPEPTWAVALGPYATRDAARGDEGRIWRHFKPEIVRIFEWPKPGRIEARDAEGRLVAQAEGYLGVRAASADSLTRARKLRASYRPWAERGQWAGKDNLTYRGHIELWINAKGRLSLVNRVFIEHYVYGVVQPEIGSGALHEINMVQAVIARSEAISKMRFHRHRDLHCDLCDTVHCQVYKGASHESEKSNGAVDETWGQVCVHGNRVCDTVYSESCGGVTANSEDAWEGRPVPYLRGRFDAASATRDPKLGWHGDLDKWLRSRPDVFCNPAQKGYPRFSRKSHFRWRGVYSAEGLARKIRRRYPGVDKVLDLKIVRRSKTGRVVEIEVVTNSLGAIRIKQDTPICRALYVRSTLFTIDREYDAKRRLKRVTILGAGHGHGVGLCQVGATVMATQGYDYISILKHYFKEADVYRIYD